MSERDLIFVLAQQQGRGHAELRRMARVGVLKDADGNPVTPEQLAYSDDKQAQDNPWITRVDGAWREYQSMVLRLRGLMNLDDAQDAEWDQRKTISETVYSINMRLRNIEVNPDQDWNERCIDRAHEFCIDMQTRLEELQGLIREADEDYTGEE